jgi:hypothetical protein
MVNLLKTFAVFFAILFIGSTAFAFALYSVEQSAFDAQLYIQAFDDENVYQRLPELVGRALATAALRPDRNDLLSVFRNLSEEEWQIFVSELFPPDVLRSLSEDSVTQMMAYINGESDTAILSLGTLKAHLQSPEGVSAIYGMLKAQPDCTVEQLTAMALNQQALTLCNPPESFLFVDLRPIIEAQIGAAMSLIPEQVTLVTADASRIQRLRDLQALKLFMRLSPLLPLMCLLMIAALAVRSLIDWLNWWGYPFLFAGLVSMLLSAVSGPIAALTFRVFIGSALPDSFPPEVANVFRDLSAAIVRNAVRPTLPVAGLMALIGLIMVALTFLLRNRQQKSAIYMR